ncbi:hypothetical protein GGR57DRAFT_138815 [Xylariaceae sp. FL1272]|nr:hypothetical protein GGR57DRAFT_138815 [Xylariaceae sp. FL1272]
MLWIVRAEPGRLLASFPFCPLESSYAVGMRHSDLPLRTCTLHLENPTERKDQFQTTYMYLPIPNRNIRLYSDCLVYESTSVKSPMPRSFDLSPYSRRNDTCPCLLSSCDSWDRAWVWILCFRFCCHRFILASCWVTTCSPDPEYSTRLDMVLEMLSQTGLAFKLWTPQGFLTSSPHFSACRFLAKRPPLPGIICAYVDPIPV